MKSRLTLITALSLTSLDLKAMDNKNDLLSLNQEEQDFNNFLENEFNALDEEIQNGKKISKELEISRAQFKINTQEFYKNMNEHYTYYLNEIRSALTKVTQSKETLNTLLNSENQFELPEEFHSLMNNFLNKIKNNDNELVNEINFTLAQIKNSNDNIPFLFKKLLQLVKKATLDDKNHDISAPQTFSEKDNQKTPSETNNELKKIIDHVDLSESLALIDPNLREKYSYNWSDYHLEVVQKREHPIYTFKKEK